MNKPADMKELLTEMKLDISKDVLKEETNLNEKTYELILFDKDPLHGDGLLYRGNEKDMGKYMVNSLLDEDGDFYDKVKNDIEIMDDEHYDEFADDLDESKNLNEAELTEFDKDFKEVLKMRKKLESLLKNIDDTFKLIDTKIVDNIAPGLKYALVKAIKNNISKKNAFIKDGALKELNKYYDSNK